MKVRNTVKALSALALTASVGMGQALANGKFNNGRNTTKPSTSSDAAKSVGTTQETVNQIRSNFDLGADVNQDMAVIISNSDAPVVQEFLKDLSQSGTVTVAEKTVVKSAVRALGALLMNSSDVVASMRVDNLKGLEDKELAAFTTLILEARRLSAPTSSEADQKLAKDTVGPMLNIMATSVKAEAAARAASASALAKVAIAKANAAAPGGKKMKSSEDVVRNCRRG